MKAIELKKLADQYDGMYAVYFVGDDGCAEWVADFVSKEHAQVFAELQAAKHAVSIWNT